MVRRNSEFASVCGHRQLPTCARLGRARAPVPTRARRDLGHVNALHLLAQPLRLCAAIVAISAALPLRRLAEVQADLPVAAAVRIREPADHAFATGCSVALGVVRNLVDEILQKNVVPFLPEQYAIRRPPIPPRAAGLLVVLLNRLWQRQMNHGPHRRFVDAQPEGDGSHQHSHFVRHPSFLILPAQGRFHLRVIRNRRNPALLQVFDRLLHSANRGRIHDHALPRVVAQSAGEQLQLRPRFALMHHVAQILAMEAGDVEIGLAHLQLLQNVVPDLPRRAGGEGRDRKLRKAGAQPA